MTFAVSCCIFSLTSGIATPGRYAPNDWKPFSSVRSSGLKNRGTPCTSRMWINWSAARGGRCERNAWSVSCMSVALSPRRVDHAIELGLLPPLGGVCNSAARLPKQPRQVHRLLHLDGRRTQTIDVAIGQQPFNCLPGLLIFVVRRRG